MRRLFFLLLLLSAGTACAADAVDQAAVFSMPNSSDPSVIYLRSIFGSLVDAAMHGTADDGTQNSGGVLGPMMYIFNSACLFLGMLCVAYGWVKGIVDSAHDGELLGRKMNSFFWPVRSVAGAALVLPLGSGFSLLQYVVIWLALQGVAIANSMWSAGMDYLAAGGTLSRVQVPSARPLATQILMSEVCMAAQNKSGAEITGYVPVNVVESSRIAANTGEINAGGAGGAIPVVGAVALASSTANSVYTVTNFAWARESAINKAVCGSLTWTESKQSSQGAGNTNIVKAPIMAAHGDAVRAMIAELRPAAAQIVAFQGLPSTALLDQVATNYENRLSAAAQTAISKSSDAAKSSFIASAKDGGWLFAGTYYNHMIRFNDAITSAVNTLPTVRPSEVKDTGLGADLYKDAMAVATEYAKNREGAPRAAYEAEVDDALSVPKSYEDFKRLLSLPAMKGIDLLTKSIAGSNLSPITQLRETGNTIITIGEMLQATLFTVAGFAGSNGVKLTIGNVFDVTSALGTISGSLAALFMGIVACGAFLAYYLPAIPFISWMAGVARWLVSVAEAVLAAPILGVAHVFPEGHDIVGKAAPGYMIILSMVMQPALMLCGLFISILVATALAALVNASFMTLVSGVTSGGMVGLVGFLAMVALYVFLMTTVLHISFSLVNSVPENCMRFLGGIAGAHGIATAVDQQATNKLSGSAQSATTGMGGRGLGGPGERGGTATGSGSSANGSNERAAAGHISNGDLSSSSSRND